MAHEIVSLKFSHELSEESRWLVKQKKSKELKLILRVLKMSPYFISGNVEELQSAYSIELHQWIESGQELELQIAVWW